jgi:RNA polymerase sigma-70 factor (ECF subfamily)
MDDAELVRRVLAGDTSAYATLVDSYAGRVRAVCRALVHRPAEAEDLASEAFYRGLRDLSSLQQPARFGPWLLAIARNACRDWQKDRENAQIPFSVFEPNSRNGLCEHLDRPAVEDDALADDVDELRAAVATLPEECREILWLYYTGDFTYPQLAAQLGVSSYTVNSRLTRARQLLRERLRRE